jgi:hypothetical protein
MVAAAAAVTPAWYMTLRSVAASNIGLSSILLHCLVGLAPVPVAGLVLVVAVVLVAGLAAGLVVGLMMDLICCPCSCLCNLILFHHHT